MNQINMNLVQLNQKWGSSIFPYSKFQKLFKMTIMYRNTKTPIQKYLWLTKKM